jgi:lipopolysaccharide transport system ATP-binding protein
MCSDVVIKIENLGKCYHFYDSPLYRLAEFFLPNKKFGNEYWAVRDVSFEVIKGETFGIIGRNGAGKSTLLQLISKTLSPTNGNIVVKGRVAALLELGAGFNPEFTGRENVEMTASIYGLSKKQLDQRLDLILEYAEIGDFIDQPVKTYSSGMYVRLAFSVIANLDADILIIDEALSVGDVRFQQKCIRFLNDFKLKGGTLIFVSHDTSMVLALCEKVLYLNKIDGLHTTLTGSAHDMCKMYLKDIYSDQQAVDAVELNNNKIIDENDALLAYINKGFVSKKINSLPKDSEVTVSVFNNNFESFGDGGGIIEKVLLCNNENKVIYNLKSSEKVLLHVYVKANRALDNPAITMVLKDRTGQFIYSDGTVDAFGGEDTLMFDNQLVKVAFSFNFPVLTEGVYSMDINFTDGNHYDHVTLQWAYDVLEFRVSRGRNVVGISGFPNLELTWESWTI